METLAKYTFLSAIFLILTATGCVPQFEKSSGEYLLLDGADAEGLLAKTSTGKQSLSDLATLRSKGYAINYRLLSRNEIESINGHSGGGYSINGRAINIYVNESLSSQEQAHVIAHELVHIKDDLEIDSYLQTYPYVDAAAEDFISKYSTQSIESFDQRVVSYVLGTLFCGEARAYNRNQQLANEGLQTEFFAKGSSLPQFIDQAYISKFGVSYGTNVNSMASWCLSKNSMSQIQSQLIW